MSLVTLKSIKKKFGPEDLFSNFSLTINDDERLGIIGPNGAGKSTLLKILAGEEDIDAGDIFRKNGLKTVYVEQLAVFAEGVSPNDLLRTNTAQFGGSSALQFQQGSKVMAEFGVENLDADASRFSGGQKKLLQLALAFAEEPDLLLLDEPTNHLDSERVQFLEGLLRRSSFPWVVISHDRAFLENTVKRVAEVNRIYADGVFSNVGGYRKFKTAREDFLEAEQRRIESLENVVRVEKAWLARGPKARGTKARARSERAEGMIQNLSELKDRQKQSSADISFSSSQRRTKELAELIEVSKSYGDKPVLERVSFKLVSRARIGVLGPNGSGKSTLLKIIGGYEEASSGQVKRAGGLSVTYFEQIDRDDNQGKSLKDYLAPDGDSVVFRGVVHHVASWAKRFRFGFEQLSQPISSLSGGEKARARIARLVLQESDVLLLDEPGNDLDIDTLEALEESMQEFAGAVMLISHDRYMIEAVCNSFLGVHPDGRVLEYASFEQWLKSPSPMSLETGKLAEPVADKSVASRAGKSAKLSYKDQLEYDRMEERILQAEEHLEKLQNQCAEPKVIADARLLAETCTALDLQKKEIETLYSRWETLEALRQSFAAK